MASDKRQRPDLPTRNRRVMRSDFSGFLKELGYTADHNESAIHGQRFRQQLLKVLEAKGGQTLAGSGFETEEPEPGFTNG